MSQSALASSSTGCTHASLAHRGSVSLPVLHEHNPRGTIRASRSGPRRAVVLITIQVLMIAHLVGWWLSREFGWFGGKTISPVEPSESMEFVRRGVVNAGLIFFTLALLSTLIFGRWFCGWGCHVVMLQDFCGWIMKKCGVRPKPFRSRLLIYVPLILALYMFIFPALHRWGVIPLDTRLASSLGADHWLVEGIRSVSNALGFRLPYEQLPAWRIQPHLTTTDFWQTFAGVAVAIPFLFICGFATVYFLGAKGFCTYGCPYGGFFAPLDKLAAGRIRVTDACEHCGHCTAVCTSNVRVHEEVREYGMVVDPGCMKYLDCVSVCPKDALYFGFGKPGVAKGRPKEQKPARKYDLTWTEELVFAAVFLGAFSAVRGVYNAVPMLMAAGVAGVVTFLVWKLWRMGCDENVTLHRFQLKLKGSIRPAGIVFAVIAVATLLLTIHSGVVNAAIQIAARYDRKVVNSQENIFSGNPMMMPDTMVADADRALKWYRLASSVLDGGIGLNVQRLIWLRDNWQADLDMNIAQLHSAKLDFPAAEAKLRAAITRDGPSDRFCSSLVWVLGAQHKVEEAKTYAHEMARRPGFNSTLDVYSRIAAEANEIDEAIAVCKQRLLDDPRDLYAMRLMSMLYLNTGRLEEGIRLIRETIDIDPSNPGAYRMLASALMDLGEFDQAEAPLRKAIEMQPSDYMARYQLAALLEEQGRVMESKAAYSEAEQLRLNAEAELRKKPTSK